MINIGANSNKVAYGIKHFNVDEVSDLEKLNCYVLKPGSTAFVIHDSKMYTLDNKFKWIENKMANGNNTGSSGSTGGGDLDDGDVDNGENNDPDYDGGSIDGSDPPDNNYDGGSIDGTDPMFLNYNGGSIDESDPD